MLSVKFCQGGGSKSSHRRGVSQPLHSGACVRVSRIHSNRAREFSFRTISADPDRRRTNLVGRKRCRDRSWNFRNDQREIALSAFLRTFARAEFLNVAKNRSAFETARRAD